MGPQLETALILLVYAIIAALAVVGFHYGLINETMETVILTGALGHLGISYIPAARVPLTTERATIVESPIAPTPGNPPIGGGQV